MELQMSLFAMDKEIDVQPIDYTTASKVVLSGHYARRVPSIVYSYGLFCYGSLMGVITYGIPASHTLCEGLAGEENKDRVLELNRLVIFDGAPKNGASILIGRSLRMLPRAHFVVSYADAGGWGHVGYVYQATNWLYTGMTKERTDPYIEDNHHPRHYDGDTPEERSIRTAKHRYVYVTSKGRMRKKMLRMLRYPIIESYPKGDTRRYDPENPIPANPLVGKRLK